MSDVNLLKYKTEHKQMQEDISEIKSYIKEDREWKSKKEEKDREWRENFFDKLDERYTHKERFENLKKIVYASIGVFITIILASVSFLAHVIFELNVL